MNVIPQLQQGLVESADTAKQPTSTQVLPVNLHPIPVQGKAYLTVVGNVYHQVDCENPNQCAEIRQGKHLSNDKEPYKRRKIDVGEKWQQIDYGWVRGEALVYVTNEPLVRSVNPTEQERQDDASKIVEVSFGKSMNGDGDIVVYPADTMPFIPVSLTAVYIRCRKGGTKYSIVVIEL